jgi:flavin reductase (DIM6/NTAB) family NADH-FMN oxidoreductase RutF
VTIHAEHPFLDPEPDPVRRLRGRLGGAVTLWTTGDPTERAGLTVSSLMLANGEPARLLALVDPDSELADLLPRSGLAVVQLLSWPDRDLAEAFAGTTPAPGGPFRQAAFEQTAWGPRLASAGTWAGVRLESGVDVGWSRLLTCVVEEITIGADDAPLIHRRGRYQPPSS